MVGVRQGADEAANYGSVGSGPRSRATLLRLVQTCLYVGLVGYGGAAAIGHMRDAFVAKSKWVDDEEFTAGLGLSQMVPGATSVNLATFLGYRLRGIAGAALATVAFLLPAFVLITTLSALYFHLHAVRALELIFSGLGAVVVALTLKATLSIGKTAIRGTASVAIAAAAFIAVGPMHVPVAWEIAGSAVVGFLVYGRRRPGLADSELPEQRPNPLSGWSVAGVLVGAVAIALLLEAFGGTGRVLASFAHIGLLTFGGGYAAVPVIQNEVVDKLHWVSMQEFKDGIVLGQVTPGPVLMTATFIGYKVAGFAGCLAATIGIFMPSSIVTLILADQHARIRGNRLVQSLFRGIVAGFIGVLLTVLWRFAASSLVDARTWAIGLASGIALIGFGVETLLVILGGIAVSLLWQLL